MEVAGDKYRSILNDEAKSMQWRHSGPLIFDKVNKLFEEGRTKEWPGGSIEETIHNVVRSWEMELSHKTSLNDFKTTNPEKFKLIVNGPPMVAYKFRHWGYFEGPFQGHAPSGEMVEFYVIGIMKVDEFMRAEDVEIYYDPVELFAGLFKRPVLTPIAETQQNKSADTSTSHHCPCYE
ncbi:Pathogenesis-related family protein [Citrus sinensis]|nr:Pathogenesis-related family protein [Citrus sinensis]